MVIVGIRCLMARQLMGAHFAGRSCHVPHTSAQGAEDAVLRFLLSPTLSAPLLHQIRRQRVREMVPN